MPQTRSNSRYHSLLEQGNLLIYQQRERGLVACLRHAGVTEAELGRLKILEIGCGSGGLLPLLVYYGASRLLLHGIDLDSDRVRTAKQRHPGIAFTAANATQLPFRPGTWDVVVQSTVFTSILDPASRLAAASEMIRVLRPGGFILWFDFRYNNPRNARVRRVSRREIVRDLFPGAETYFVQSVLLPPLARRLAPVSWILAELLALISPLRSHYCALIRPKGWTAENRD